MTVWSVGVQTAPVPVAAMKASWAGRVSVTVALVAVEGADLLRSLGYPKALSVAGGFQAWKKLQPQP